MKRKNVIIYIRMNNMESLKQIPVKPWFGID